LLKRTSLKTGTREDAARISFAMGHGGKGKGKGKAQAKAKSPAFQVMLGGSWDNYTVEEDQILKRAFMSGFKNARFTLRGQHYEYNLDRMKQKNVDSGKERDIRPPHKWKAPSAPVVPKGRTASVTVQKGQPGTNLTLKHPDGGYYSVAVPPSAKVGQTMLVPIPPKADAETKEELQAKTSGGGGGGGWSTGAKVAAGTAAVGVGAVAGVAGVLIAEHGLEGAGDVVADAAEDAGEAIADGTTDAVDAIGEWVPDAAEDVGDWVGEATEDVGDFFMDLF